MSVEAAALTAATTSQIPGCIVAAIDPDSSSVDEIVTRALAEAAPHDHAVVFLTIATRRPIDYHLHRARRRLLSAGFPCNLVATWIDTEHLSAPDRSAKIAGELTAAARRLRASALILGHDPSIEHAPTKIVAQVAATLDPEIDLHFGAPTLSRDLPAAIAGGSRHHRITAAVYLTDDGRERLRRRATQLARTELLTSRRRVHNQPLSATALIGYENALNDLRVLSHLVEHAPSTAVIVDDPTRVELGETVVLADEGGRRRQITVVADIEAGRGRERVAAGSAMGQALLGCRVGEKTSIPTARGPRSFRVLAAIR